MGGGGGQLNPAPLAAGKFPIERCCLLAHFLQCGLGTLLLRFL